MRWHVVLIHLLVVLFSLIFGHLLSLLNEDVWIKGRGECSDLDLALLIELSLYSLVALVAVLLLELLDLRRRSCFVE